MHGGENEPLAQDDLNVSINTIKYFSISEQIGYFRILQYIVSKAQRNGNKVSTKLTLQKRVRRSIMSLLRVLLVVLLPNPFSRVGGAKKLRGDPTVGPYPKVWTRGKKWKC